MLTNLAQPGTIREREPGSGDRDKASVALCSPACPLLRALTALPDDACLAATMGRCRWSCYGRLRADGPDHTQIAIAIGLVYLAEMRN